MSTKFFRLKYFLLDYNLKNPEEFAVWLLTFISDRMNLLPNILTFTHLFGNCRRNFSSLGCHYGNKLIKDETQTDSSSVCLLKKIAKWPWKIRILKELSYLLSLFIHNQVIQLFESARKQQFSKIDYHQLSPLSGNLIKIASLSHELP